MILSDFVYAVLSFILYTVGLFGLLYIGWIRPSWVAELFGVLVVTLSRVALYAAAMVYYSGVAVAPSPDFLSWLSRLSSFIMAFVLIAYVFSTIARIRE